MRLKFCKRSVEKFVSRIDPEAFFASGSRVIFLVGCRFLLKALATIRGEEFHLMTLKLLKRNEEKFVSQEGCLQYQIDSDDVAYQGLIRFNAA